MRLLPMEDDTMLGDAVHSYLQSQRHAADG